MKNTIIFVLLMSVCIAYTQNNTSFNYQIQLTPVSIPNFPGIHSFAFGQHNGKWLIVGGRLDGIHARQPFNAFPASSNNTNLYVVDVATSQFWTKSIANLPIPLKEQLQATNFNFYQDNTTLYLIGGYAFSETAQDHITFNKLTAIDVPNLIDAIINNGNIDTYFKQISDENLAINGGQLGKIANTFYLVGGHRFDGRYNPMNNPTFTQTYSNQIKKFTINNTANGLSISNYETITDAIHLHRRDYNLMPQIFPNGEQGYTISSGVFQINVDLPFLYPVDIKASGYFPQTNFNQYLSNYHSAKVSLYTAENNQMHNLFFGGMSQYYYNGTTLIQDTNVPFVNTISRVTRFADGTLQEFQQPEVMPALKGASAEFIINKALPHYENEVVKLDEITSNEIVLGHIVGGLYSPSQNPFTVNQTSTTQANNTIYEVKLIKNQDLNNYSVPGKNPYDIVVSPNPSYTNKVKLQYYVDKIVTLDYFISSLDGKIIDDGEIQGSHIGNNTLDFEIDAPNNSTVMLTFIFDDKYYVTKKVVLN
ncbi:hypothetical protein [Flavobacterium croceum]|uniref:hypothetical protein n=1 Tax=Flavobacterium croceum TaxID=370975 RepID=UPI0024A7D3C9|nr:hypothetical protein [Flavobacterium croceum]